jgi:hypothetical protein
MLVPFKNIYTTDLHTEHVQTVFVFLISGFRHALYVLCFLLAKSPASEVYLPTFRNTLVCSIFIGR